MLHPLPHSRSKLAVASETDATRESPYAPVSIETEASHRERQSAAHLAGRPLRAVAALGFLQCGLAILTWAAFGGDLLAGAAGAALILAGVGCLLRNAIDHATAGPRVASVCFSSPS